MRFSPTPTPLVIIGIANQKHRTYLAPTDDVAARRELGKQRLTRTPLTAEQHSDTALAALYRMHFVIIGEGIDTLMMLKRFAKSERSNLSLTRTHTPNAEVARGWWYRRHGASE